MAIFHSKDLDRSVTSDEIPNLSSEDIEILRSELLDCIKSINKSLSEVSSFQQRHGFPGDQDWQHRAKKKLMVCTHFAAKIEAFEVGDPVVFKDAYEKRLREILLEELGPVTLEKIEKEAAELAREDAAKSIK